MRTGGATSFGFRTDIGTLRPPRRMDDGRLVADAHITKPGIFEYPDASMPGGIRRELREPKEVFDQASLDSFSMVPITNKHPPVMLNSDNAKSYMVGSTGERITRDDDHVKAPVMVTDAKTIAELEKGDVEVSCGYACEVEETPGVHPVYGKYDAVQRNIRGNHLAVAVGAARAGRTARVRMDAELSADERAIKARGDKEKITAARNPLGGTMDPKQQEKYDSDLRALGVSRDSEKQRADAAETEAKTLKGRAEEAESSVKALKSRIDQLNAELAESRTASETVEIKKLKDRVDTAEAAVSRFDETLKTKVRARAKLEREASIVLGPDFRMDDLDNRQVRVAAIKRMDSSMDVSESVSKDGVKGIFNTLIEQKIRHADSMAATAQVLSETHREKPRQDQHDELEDISRNAWKHPLKITRYSDAKRS